MSDLNFSEVQPLIFILLGVTLLLIAIFKRSSSSNLRTLGNKTEGIVYTTGYSNDPRYDNSSNIKDKITVRFVTNKNEWITGDVKQGFAIYFTKQYKDGQTLDIYYDPERPSNFFVDTKQSETIGRIVFVVVGLIFCVVGLFQLFS